MALRVIVILAASVDWLRSPHHAAAGFCLAFVVALAARRRVAGDWLAVILAIGVVSAAEVGLEIVEYMLVYSRTIHQSAYLDTISDLAATLFGSVSERQPRS